MAASRTTIVRVPPNHDHYRNMASAAFISPSRSDRLFSTGYDNCRSSTLTQTRSRQTFLPETETTSHGVVVCHDVTFGLGHWTIRRARPVVVVGYGVLCSSGYWTTQFARLISPHQHLSCADAIVNEYIFDDAGRQRVPHKTLEASRRKGQAGRGLRFRLRRTSTKTRPYCTSRAIRKALGAAIAIGIAEKTSWRTPIRANETSTWRWSPQPQTGSHLLACIRPQWRAEKVPQHNATLTLHKTNSRSLVGPNQRPDSNQSRTAAPQRTHDASARAGECRSSIGGQHSQRPMNLREDVLRTLLQNHLSKIGSEAWHGPTFQPRKQ